MTTNFFEQFVQDMYKRSAVPKKTREELLQMNDRDMFMELIRDIATELNMDRLCLKMLLNCDLLMGVERASLYLKKGTKDDQYLVSKLFDVTEASVLADVIQSEETQQKIMFGYGIPGLVAQTRVAINISDVTKDGRFDKNHDAQRGVVTRNLLCLPILDQADDVIGVVKVMNKTDESQIFTVEDIEVFRTYLTFCGICLTNASIFEVSVGEAKNNGLLLTMANGIFTKQSTLDKLVKHIMLDALALIKCLRCYVFLITTISEKEFEITKAYQMNPSRSEAVTQPSTEDLTLAQSAYYARAVTRSIQSLIVNSKPDTEEPNETDYDGFEIMSSLTVPITNEEKQVIAIVQMINKSTGKPFLPTDASNVEAFTIIWGLGIHNCQLYENVCKLMARERVAVDGVRFQTMANPRDTNKLGKDEILSAEDYKIYDFMFLNQDLEEIDTYKVVICMMLELPSYRKLRVPYEILVRWTVMVKNNYCTVRRHGWRHAVSVMQTMFAFLTTGKLAKYMDDLEIVCLMIASLCHDLDHRDITNSTLIKQQSPLAELYSSSILQHHHYEQCVMILSNPPSNILCNLKPNDFPRALLIIENAIIATDPAVFIRKRRQFSMIVNNAEKRWIDQPQKELLCAMLMTASDMNSVYKPWDVQERLPHLTLDYHDLRKFKSSNKAGRQEEFPRLHIEYLNICLPVFQLLVKVEPLITPVVRQLTTNITNWKGLMKKHKDLKDENETTDSAPTKTGIKKTKIKTKEDKVEKLTQEKLVSMNELPGPPPKDLEPVYCVTGGIYTTKTSFTRNFSREEEDISEVTNTMITEGSKNQRPRACMIM